jgi:hypothetical protein
MLGELPPEWQREVDPGKYSDSGTRDLDIFRVANHLYHRCC